MDLKKSDLDLGYCGTLRGERRRDPVRRVVGNSKDPGRGFVSTKNRGIRTFEAHKRAEFGEGEFTSGAESIAAVVDEGVTEGKHKNSIIEGGPITQLCDIKTWGRRGPQQAELLGEPEKEESKGGKREPADVHARALLEIAAIRAGGQGRSAHCGAGLRIILSVAKAYARAPGDVLNPDSGGGTSMVGRTDTPGLRRDRHAARPRRGNSTHGAAGAARVGFARRRPRAGVHAQAAADLQVKDGRGRTSSSHPARIPACAVTPESMRAPSPRRPGFAASCEMRAGERDYTAQSSIVDTARENGPGKNEGHLGVARAGWLGGGWAKAVGGRRDTAHDAYCDARGEKREDTVSIDTACDVIRRAMGALSAVAVRIAAQLARLLTLYPRLVMRHSEVRPRLLGGRVVRCAWMEVN
ncbi:hypothetical protein DFH09DRAFT_1097030 [Mycena vulgaris]|nr:hypothetical protein DFH09DRAFT_1097030 [Mycena vulgaris]